MTIAPAALTPPTLALPEYTYKIPESAREWTTDPTSVTIRSFTVGLELDAIAAAVGERVLAYEILQRCVIRMNGKPVDQGFDLMTECSPKVRSLLTTAVNKLFLPSADETKDFLGSVEVKVP
jgi:hypothetical protein